jgi:DNA-binding GntR family transcriptional regulator
MELQTIGAKTYEHLRGQILTHELPPGSLLAQRRIAREMGIGTNSLREALVRLECDGLIECVPKWGARVREWDEIAIRSLYDLREAVECQVARLCAERSSGAERDALTQAASELDSIYDHPPVDYSRVVPMDASFHQRLATCAHSSLLEQEHRRLNVLAQMVRTTADRDPNFRHESRMHARLVEPIVAKNTSAAEDAMRHHIRHSLNNALTARPCGYGNHRKDS